MMDRQMDKLTTKKGSLYVEQWYWKQTILYFWPKFQNRILIIYTSRLISISQVKSRFGREQDVDIKERVNWYCFWLLVLYLAWIYCEPTHLQICHDLYFISKILSRFRLYSFIVLSPYILHCLYCSWKSL